MPTRSFCSPLFQIPGFACHLGLLLSIFALPSARMGCCAQIFPNPFSLWTKLGGILRRAKLGPLQQYGAGKFVLDK